MSEEKLLEFCNSLIYSVFEKTGFDKKNRIWAINY